jgi:hypothetical protein
MDVYFYAQSLIHVFCFSDYFFTFTDKCFLNGSGHHVGQYICTSAAVDITLCFFTLQTVSMEWITSAKCGTVLLFGWHPKGKTSSVHEVFLKTHEYIFHTAA